MGLVAKLLEPTCTVFQYDRRGRNESGDASPYSMEREIEDLEALAKEAGGSPFVFGISSGAVLIARAAIKGLPFKKIGLFEPPLELQKSPKETAGTDHSVQLKKDLSSGRPGDAIQYFLKSMVGVPSVVVMVMRLLPVWSKLKAVSHTLLYDAEITKEGSLSASDVASIQEPTIVIWGEKSSPFLKEAAQRFSSNLPNATGLELKGQSHNASGKVLVPVLNHFFGFLT
jgi:pimeloyl-ACP methyl ester carboxylesterase